jgi:hypothetical protein
MEKYEVTRKCTECGFEVKAPLTKREAAFELYDTKELFGLGCGVCGSEKNIVEFPAMTLDEWILSEWAQDERLFLMKQDEELFLAQGEYLELILKALDSPRTLPNKKYVLLDSLCVIIYDNSVGDEGEFEPDIELKNRVIEELNRRKDLLIQAGEWIMDYIKEVVYPRLEIDWRSKN